MTSFETEYLSLLMRQVNEEIEYLVRNGHGTDRNYSTLYVLCPASNAKLLVL